MVIPPSLSAEKPCDQMGQRWHNLVAHVNELPISDPHAMALSLTVRRIQKRFGESGDWHAGADSLCPTCAADIVSSYPGSEHELIEMFYVHLEEIYVTLKTMRNQPRRAKLQSSAA